MTGHLGYLPPDPAVKRCSGCQKPFVPVEIPADPPNFRITAPVWFCERCDRADRGGNVLLYEP